MLLTEKSHTNNIYSLFQPPNGFDTCAVCTCETATLEISCPRTQCPPLNCSEKVAYRQDKKSCCKRCPEVNIFVQASEL